ncbi:polysaccharide biosynthesis/export family protein [Mucilaginibacter sp. HD30]
MSFQKNYFNIIILAGYCILFSACSQVQYQPLFQAANNFKDNAYIQVDSLENYKIKAQDIIQVRNLQSGEILLNNINTSSVGLKGTGSGTAPADLQTFQVGDDGMVLLPAIGKIKVAGYTRQQAEKLVDQAYRKNVFTDPIIELKITSLQVIIFGEAKAQGSFRLTKEHMSLTEMIGAAGGLTERADATNIQIIRGTQKNPKVTIVDMTDIQAINDPKAILQNGDIVYISLNKRAAKSANFQNFSSSNLQPFLLIINAALILYTLIRR